MLSTLAAVYAESIVCSADEHTGHTFQHPHVECVCGRMGALQVPVHAILQCCNDPALLACAGGHWFGAPGVDTKAMWQHICLNLWKGWSANDLAFMRRSGGSVCGSRGACMLAQRWSTCLQVAQSPGYWCPPRLFGPQLRLWHGPSVMCQAPCCSAAACQTACPQTPLAAVWMLSVGAIDWEHAVCQ